MNQENHNNFDEISDLRHEIGVNQKDPNFDFLFKIITIGDPGNKKYLLIYLGSGKSCLLNRLIQNQYVEGHVTVGVEFNSFMLRVEDNLLKM